MTFGPAYGTRDSGALEIATRSDNNNPAVFTDFNALAAYTLTAEGTADAAAINVGNIDFAEEVFAVGSLDPSNNVTGISAAYARVNGVWVSVATNILGAAGAAGTNGSDGLDGNTFDFKSTAERDTFFTANPTILENNLSISVTEEDNTVAIQVWRGGPLTSYVTDTHAKFWTPASVRSGTASFELGNVHTISSGGENIFFTNEDSDMSYFPAWQGVGDHRTLAGRTVINRPTGRRYGDLVNVEPNGALQINGSVAYDNTLVDISQDTAIFGVSFVLAETYSGDLKLEASTGSVGVVFNFTQAVVGVAGTTVNMWFQYPVEGHAGSSVNVRVIKDNAEPIMVRPGSTIPTVPYRQQHLRTFADAGLLFQDEYTPPQADWNETDTKSLAYIENKPTIPPVRTDLQIRNLTMENLTVTGFGSGTHNSATGKYTINIGNLPDVILPIPSISSFTTDIDRTIDISDNLNRPIEISYNVHNYSQITSIDLITSSGDDITLTAPIRDGVHNTTVTLANIVTSSPGDITFRIRISYNDGTNTVTTDSNVVTVSVVASNGFYWTTSTVSDLSGISSTSMTRVDKFSTTSSYNISTDIAANEYLWLFLDDNTSLSNIEDLITSENVLTSFTETDSDETSDAITGRSYRLSNILSGLTVGVRLKVDL